MPQKFEEYFVPIKNEIVTWHIFLTSDQGQGELFDTYLSEKLLKFILKNKVLTFVKKIRTSEGSYKDEETTKQW